MHLRVIKVSKDWIGGLDWIPAANSYIEHRVEASCRSFLHKQGKYHQK